MIRRISFKVTIIQRLAYQELEKYRIALVEGPILKTGFVVENFWHDELVVIPYHHPWAQKGSITLNELTKQGDPQRSGVGHSQVIELFFVKKRVQVIDFNITMEVGITSPLRMW